MNKSDKSVTLGMPCIKRKRISFDSNPLPFPSLFSSLLSQALQKPAVDFLKMAVEMMVVASNVPEKDIKEAAAAGMESVEQVLTLLSQTNLGSSRPDHDIEAVADVAVNNFKKVISLLDRTRTGHARFRRAPVGVGPSAQQVQEPGPSGSMSNEQKVSAFRVYQPTPIHGLPPLPHKTINFSNSPQISGMSSLTGDTESMHHSMSSGFKITNQSNGMPPLPSSSSKRKCNSMDDGVFRCGSSSSSVRCHCSKKR